MTMQNIFIEKNIINSLKNYVKINFISYSKLILISDSFVSHIYKNEIKQILTIDNFLIAKLIVVPEGENSKSREMKAYIEDKMSSYECHKDTLVLAFGGGVITDLAGFVAATYCRGVPIIYIPTTLLAQVDASIGGKTGINTQFGKNLIGAFKKPYAIFIDCNFILTLKDLEYYSAFGEIIKHAIIKDKDYFNLLFDNFHKIANRDLNFLEDLVATSIKIKNYYVAKDENEKGLREVLNFGHTIAHAIEVASNYGINHGNAVLLGMLVESFISYKMQLLDFHDFKLIFALINKFNINNCLVDCLSSLDTERINNLLIMDKKNKNNQIRMILIKKIGEVLILENNYSHQVDELYINLGLKFLFEKDLINVESLSY